MKLISAFFTAEICPIYCQNSGYLKLQYHFFHRMDSKFTLKDFEIIKDLGTGSYGRVQLVKRKSDQKYYALKSVFLANAKQKEKGAALNEIRLLASIDMPYVVSYKSSFYAQDIQSLCIVMEFADGGDLEAMINLRMDSFGYSGFNEEFIWKTAFQVLKGLKGLHEHNIIHRDLKCANIFFANGVAKIGDLNISKITDNGFASTQTGTPYYTSPEIWKGQKYDSKCDIWALGCIIYEMCTLLPPFRADDFPSLFKAVSNGTYEDIPKKYSQNLRDFIALCLKVDPIMRPGAYYLLEKPYFAKYDVSVQGLSTDLEDRKQVKLIEPIECPKVLNYLNQKLPKSKFGEERKEEDRKKTVCFIEHENPPQSSFKIKTKKFKSEKTITIPPETPKADKNVPNFISQKSSKQLPPLETQSLKKSKSSKLIPSENGSMKGIVSAKQSKRLIIR